MGNDQRNFGFLRDVARDAAQHHFTHPRAAIGPHHQRVRPRFLRLLQDLLANMTALRVCDNGPRLDAVAGELGGETVGILLVSGVDFSPGQDETASSVAVVNAATSSLMTEQIVTASAEVRKGRDR